MRAHSDAKSACVTCLDLVSHSSSLCPRLREREGEALFDDDATSEDKDELQHYPRDARNLLSAFECVCER